MLKKSSIALFILLAMAVFFVPAGRRVINVLHKNKASPVQAPVEANRKSLIQDEVMSYRIKSKKKTKQAQIALKKAKLYNGDIDGKLGQETKKAIKAFQKSKGLNPDGVIGLKTWEELSKLLKD